MSRKEIYALPNIVTPSRPVVFSSDLCTGCNACVEVCQMDVFIPNPNKGNAPIILFPDECWYCGSCVEHCPQQGAIRLNHPLMQRARWKRKTSGEHFRV